MENFRYKLPGKKVNVMLIFSTHHQNLLQLVHFNNLLIIQGWNDSCSGSSSSSGCEDVIKVYVLGLFIKPTQGWWWQNQDCNLTHHTTWATPGISVWSLLFWGSLNLARSYRYNSGLGDSKWRKRFCPAFSSWMLPVTNLIIAFVHSF